MMRNWLICLLFLLGVETSLGGTTVYSDTNIFFLNRPTEQNISTSLVFSAIHTTNIAVLMPYPEGMISDAKIYATKTNVYSKTTTLTFYSGNDYKASNAYWRANIPLISVPISVGVIAPTNIVTVTDGSGFTANDLVYFTQSSEYGRVSAIVGGALTLEDNVQFGHATTSSVTRVGEFGGFSTVDKTGTSNMFIRLDASNTTQDIRFDFKIRR